jgi:hypothetical protein
MEWKGAVKTTAASYAALFQQRPTGRSLLCALHRTKSHVAPANRDKLVLQIFNPFQVSGSVEMPSIFSTKGLSELQESESLGPTENH